MRSNKFIFIETKESSCVLLMRKIKVFTAIVGVVTSVNLLIIKSNNKAGNRMKGGNMSTTIEFADLF